MTEALEGAVVGEEEEVLGEDGAEEVLVEATPTMGMVAEEEGSGEEPVASVEPEDLAKMEMVLVREEDSEQEAEVSDRVEEGSGAERGGDLAREMGLLTTVQVSEETSKVLVAGSAGSALEKTTANPGLEPEPPVEPVLGRVLEEAKM